MHILQRAVPPIKGELSLSGLKESVHVYRDKKGIPHIRANNEIDLYRTLGWVHASERLFQLDLYRRASTGELSEILGEVTLKKDRLSKTLLFDSPYDHPSRVPLSDEAKKRVNAYLDGLNSFIEKGPLPIEFKLLNYKPRRFILRDVYSFIGYMAYLFGNAPKQDPLFQKFKKYYDAQTISLLSNDYVESNKEVISGFPVNLEPLYQQDAIYLPPVTGSNAWLIGPNRTVSGKALLANDPHVGISLPGLWFEAHLKAPGFEVYGHFLPLIPFGALGHNKDRAWGMTISYIDDMDFYEEKVDWKSKEVTFRGKQVPLKKHNHIISTKGKEDEEFISWSGPHGPLLGKASRKEFSKPEYALQWTFHHKDNRPLEAFYKFSYAKNIDDMRLAVTLGTAPGLNIMYADAKGNIAWWMYGAIPLRPRGMNGDLVYPGENGKFDWYGHTSVDDKPQIENPASGVIVSANGRPPGAKKSVRGYWQPQDRAQTIFEKLTQKEKFSPEDMMALQVSNFNKKAPLFRDLLFKSLVQLDKKDNVEALALEQLLKWSGHSEASSAGALIYNALSLNLLRNLFDELSYEDYLSYCAVNSSWRALYRISELPNHSIWDIKRTTEIEQMEQVVVVSFKETIKELRKLYGDNVASWNWGKHHQVEFRHPLGSRGGLLGKVFNLGPFEAPGAYNSINNFRRLGCKNDFAVRAGPSTRRIIDFGNPSSTYGGLPLGISGHLKSPYYQNEREDFLNGKHRKQQMDWNIIKNYSDLIFTPAP